MAFRVFLGASPTGVDNAVPVADSVALADAITIAWVQDRAGDTVTPSDSLTRAVTAARTVTDSITLTDSATRVKTIPKSLTDSIALTDSLSKVSVIARAVADSIALADNCTPVHTTFTAHTVTINDSLLGQLYGGGEYGEDSYGPGLSDNFSRVSTSVRSVADSIALADAAALGRGKPIADTVSLTDSITPLLIKTVNVNDSVTVDDLFARAVGYARAPADGLVLADQTLDAQGLKLADLVALADVISRVGAKSLTDSVALSDLFSRVSVSLRSVADTVALSDSASQSTSSADVLNLSDAVAITDAFSRVATANRTVADSIALADALSATKVLALALSSVVVTTDDVFNRAVTYRRTPADSLVLLDQLSFVGDGSLGFSDLVGLSDAQVVNLISLSTLLDEIYTGRIAMTTAGDNGSGERGEISDTVAGVIEEELVEV